jgi:hypothetical protein
MMPVFTSEPTISPSPAPTVAPKPAAPVVIAQPQIQNNIGAAVPLNPITTSTVNV